MALARRQVCSVLELYRSQTIAQVKTRHSVRAVLLQPGSAHGDAPYHIVWQWCNPTLFRTGRAGVQSNGPEPFGLYFPRHSAFLGA